MCLTYNTYKLILFFVWVWVVERKDIGGLIIVSSIQPMRLSGRMSF